MEIVVLLPAVLVFLYAFYKLVKDDYVFIRKGISLEQAFDLAFISLWVSLIVSRLAFLLFNFQPGKNIFLQFFSLKDPGLSLIGSVIGGTAALLVLGRYKKIPLGRIGDFFSLSFLFALPVGYLGSALLAPRNELLYALLNVVLYFLLMMFFVQFLKPKLMSRALKEGTLSILFLVFFSLISLVVALIPSLKNLQAFLFNPSTIVTAVVLVISIFFYFKEERPFSPHRRVLR